MSAAVDEIMQEEMKIELTPMIDVAFLIIIFFMCLPFKTLDGKLQAFLPTDKGISPIEQDPLNEIMVKVHIVARAEKPGTFGPPEATQQVTKPTVFKFKIGDTETDDITEVADYIDQAYKTAEGSENTVVKGEIKAGHKVPHKFVVAILNQFAKAGLEKVDFYGTAIPKKDLRTKRYLPYPKKNYVTSG
jgi:biopolymer transport protein ExbD